MKKFLLTFFALILTTISSCAKDMRFVQVDGALYSSANQEQFKTLINKINNEKNVEFVVFTGDNIAKPNQKYLEEFIKLSKDLKSPFYIVLGNKDLNKQKNLGKKEYMEILGQNLKFYRKIDSPNYLFEKNKWIFITVDGAKEIIPTSGGYYKTETLDWLSNKLNFYREKNVILLQHFPIIPPAKKETKYTYKVEEYYRLLSNFKNVKAVISGNFNTNNEQNINNILHISTANAPQYRIIDIIDYETESPTIWTTIKD